MSWLSTLWLTIIGLGWAFAETDNVTKIVLITSSTSQQIYGLDQTSEIVKSPNFDLNRESVLYIHGYVESLSTFTTQLIINAYITEATYNIFALDWSILAGGLYPSAVNNANQLGSTIAGILINLFNIGLKSDTLHIVGHSLGAHLAGKIGRTVISDSNQAIKLKRISGLDPAFPLYYPPILGVQHINSNDASFVDIIHTDAGGYGAPEPTGTVDFWVNEGRRFQPGCPEGFFMFLSDDDLCSHHRSVQVWAESVSTPSSLFTATLNQNTSVKSRMGLDCPTNATPGCYSIQTNSMSPYSKG